MPWVLKGLVVGVSHDDDGGVNSVSPGFVVDDKPGDFLIDSPDVHGGVSGVGRLDIGFVFPASGEGEDDFEL